MNKIEVKILDHNLNGMPLFLACLTQRGHEISNMQDVYNLYERTVGKHPSEKLMRLPHTTLKRKNYMTVAIVGLSTKAVSQIRTHATRLTFVSTSTQYSAYHERSDNFVLPGGLSKKDEEVLRTAYEKIHNTYSGKIMDGLNQDTMSYLLPQGLRKTLIAHGDLDSWGYVIRTRLCRRNTLEVQHIMRKLYNLVYAIDPVWTRDMLPPCTRGACPEGHLSCGHKILYKEGELEQV